MDAESELSGLSQYWPMDAGDELYGLSEWDYERFLVVFRRLEEAATWKRSDFWCWYLEEFKEGFE